MKCNISSLILRAGITLAVAGSGATVAAQEIAAAGSKTCYVNKLRFENEGGYELSLFKIGGYQLRGFLSQGQSRTWDIEQTNLSSGTEVYLTYRIDEGDQYSRKSCEKDGTTLIYHPDGNTWSYWSKGTTKINNRCRFRNNTCVEAVSGS